MTLTIVSTSTISIDAIALTKAIAAIRPAIAKPRIPVLSHVKIVAAGDGKVTFTGTELDITLEATVAADAPDPFEALIPLALLTKALKVFKKGTVTIELIDRDNASISLNNSALKVRTGPINEYPRIAHAGGRTTEINLAALVDVLPAVSSDDSRPILASMLVEHGSYVATDSYRLHTVDTTDDTGDAFLLPLAACKVLAKHKGTAPVSVDERTITVYLGDEEMPVALTARLQEGEFPPYKNLLPTGTNVGTTFTEAFVADVKTAAALGGTGLATLRIEPNDNGIMLRFREQDVADTEVISPGVCTIAVGFNPGYFLDCLAGMSTTELLCVDSLKPAMLVEPAPQFGEGSVRRRLIMPVRVS